MVATALTLAAGLAGGALLGNTKGKPAEVTRTPLLTEQQSQLLS